MLSGYLLPSKLISVPDDGPPNHIDVTFQDARFQVCELFDPCRRRQAEINQRIGDLKAATTPDAAQRGYPSDYVSMSHAEAYALITKELAKKASSYEASARAKLDALVHMQLHWRSLDADSPLSDYTALLQQGWRSVSLVLRTASHVVYAHRDAPAFLQDSVGHTKKWDGTGPFFDL